MPDNENLIFTERFQEIYEFLGIFGSLYFGTSPRGIDRDTLALSCVGNAVWCRMCLSFCLSHRLIVERDSLLYPATGVLSGMSLWDLLVLAEPWLGHSSPCSPSGEEYESLRRLAGAENLSWFYM